MFARLTRLADYLNIAFPFLRVRAVFACLLVGGALTISDVSTAATSGSSSAAGEADPVHWTANVTRCDRKRNHCELIGTAALHQKSESLYADSISLDLVARVVTARGHVVFVGETALIQADEMNYNLDTKTGSITRGRVSNELFTLTGERINKLGPGRFQTHRGEYSTCRDCPKSWSLVAEDVDLEVEGYAFMNGVITKIDDAPAIWLPYLVIPIKAKRQTGFLVPRFQLVPALGVSYIQPFFWATSRSTDFTFGLGKLADRGLRVEGEGRYELRNGEGKINYFDTRDRRFRADLANAGWSGNPRYADDRWSLFAVQRHELPFGIHEQFRYADVSDSFYPSELSNDVSIGDPTGGVARAARISRANSVFPKAPPTSTPPFSPVATATS